MMIKKQVINYTKEEDGVKAEFETKEGVLRAVWVDDDFASLESEGEFDRQITNLKEKLDAYKIAKSLFTEAMKEVENGK